MPDRVISVPQAAQIAQRIKNKFDNVNGRLHELQTGKIVFESGTFNDYDGVTKTARTSRVRTANPVYLENLYSIQNPSKYWLWIFWLDESMALLGNSGWLSAGTRVFADIIPDGTVYANIAVQDHDAPTGDISSDVALVENAIVFMTKQEKTNNDMETALATANSEIENINVSIGKIESGRIELKTETTLADYSENVGSGVYTSTRRWFYPAYIPTGGYIGKVKYRTANAVSGTVVFEVWESDGTDLTKVKTVTSTPASASVNEVDIDYTAQAPALLSWKPTDGTSFRYDNIADNPVWASADLTSDTLAIGDINTTSFTTFKPCVTLSYTTTKDTKIVTTSPNVVLIGPGMQYEQIQDALNGISDDSAEKPYTFLLMPKAEPYEPFSMLRSAWTVTYPWNSITPRHISIIGLDKAHCIIRSDSGNYKLPCGEPMTNGIIKGITFIMTNDEQDPNAGQGGYCLHIDCRTLNDVGYDMTIEDCDFEDSSGPCLGIGMHENCTLKIKGCSFKTTLSADYNPHEGYKNLYTYGCIFAHTSSRADAQKQHIIFEDCIGTCKEGTKSLFLAHAGSYSQDTAEFVYTLIRNVFWNLATATPAYAINNDLTADVINFGNNKP